jgi:hypothetical protein
MDLLRSGLSLEMTLGDFEEGSKILLPASSELTLTDMDDISSLRSPSPGEGVLGGSSPYSDEFPSTDGR